MKKMQAFLMFLAFALMGFSASLHAEDTDIYVDNASTSGMPNVLFVMDTGANFSSSAAVPCTAYADGGAPSLGDTAGGIEQCALVDSLAALADGSVNIGILVNNNNNFGTDVRSTSDAAYHETCQGTYGGCVIRKLTLMNAANKASLINFIKSWKTSGSNSATEFNVKSGGDRTANTMQEAWAYYNGKTGMSTKDYGTSILASGCQKNFIIYVGNAFNNSGGPADGGSESPYNGTYGLTATQTGATTTQTLKISETVSFNPATCGVTSKAANTTASNWSENWADEWARLMYEQDGGATTAEGRQSITTYTIGVVNDASCKADYPALLSTMAKYGNGTYFKTSTANDVKIAMGKILNEVQAVNSVFSSASLPVSVNSQGQYLNQIYLGMFRPDATGAPRWTGNLKQYQAVKDSSNNLVLGDAAGEPALSAAGTGFISPNAISFWNDASTTFPDDAATGGFWVNDKKGVPATGYDRPDGEVVEKGGVSRKLRLENLTADFAATAGGTTNPRRLYTYCPTGSSCNTGLTHSTNQFSIANGDIGAAAFGSSTTIQLVSIVRTGTTALVTTNGNHGFATGNTVTISNAGQAEYNVTQAITVNSNTTFTITGLPDYPTTPSAGTYTITSAGGSPVVISSIVRGTSTTGNKNSETVTVTTAAAHGFTTSSNIVVTGASPTAFNYSGTPATVPSSTALTFPVTVEPKTPAANTYQVAFSAAAYPAKTVSLSKSSNNVIGGSTSAAHGFWVGQSITVAGSAESNYNGTWTILSIPSTTSFTADRNGLGNPAASAGTVSVDTTAKTLSTLTRAATTVSATAAATGAPSLFLGSSIGGTRTVNITKLSGTGSGETAYVQSNVTITCTNATCTTFTYPITVTPADSATGTMYVALSGATVMNIAAGGFTRSTAGIVTVTGATANAFANGQTVTVAVSGSALSDESAYVGAWPITCTSPCTTFTYGPVTLTPVSPATGTNMQAYSGSTPPDRDTAIKWLRGHDNYGDEKGPGGTVTVRPSIHGDVLHSRPFAVNYGDGRGIVVYYGANDGVFRAINGNQTAAMGSVPAGGELWGLIFPDHFGEVNRLRVNSPELKFPSTTLSTAQPKDYFVDGPTGAMQFFDSNGIIQKAYLYLTMRRGGRFVYALDVTTPTAPSVVWKIDSSVTGFSELGQTWSRPVVTVLQGSPTAPVTIFGAGYDPAEDTELPTTNTMGRGIYIVNALTGALIWSANSTCTTSATCLNVPGMIYSIPSEITAVDRDNNGFIDKLYFGDMGGNVWRADVSDVNSAAWTVTKLAALGCDTGAPPCASGGAPRKFFFPPVVLTLSSSTVTSYDAVMLSSGDREHPLKSTATGSSYNVVNRAFMIKDMGVALGTPVTNNVTLATLVNSTSTKYNNSGDGFYFSLATGEKGVNAPIVVNGLVFFGTNRPVDRSATCSANLGEANAWVFDPFTGAHASHTFAGGGLPPSAVSGQIIIDGTPQKICIGCGTTTIPRWPEDGGNITGDSAGGGSSAADCDSSLGFCKPPVKIPKSLKRTYWYKK